MTPLLPGSAEARVLKLPSLSLWGGVDPFSVSPELSSVPSR